MDSQQIRRVLSSIKQFKGVFPSDRLPAYIPKSSFIIVNLDPHYLPGSHWITIYIDKHGSAEYFCSYASKPHNADIIRFLRRRKHYAYNRRRLQSNSAIVCGHYSCLYGVYRAAGYSMTDFTGLFSRSLCANDRLILHMFKELFGPSEVTDLSMLRRCLFTR